MRKVIIVALAASALAACGTAEPEIAAPEYTERQYMQAINDIARMDDLDDDARRQPAALLAFAQIDKGELVGDFIMGSGYWTKLLAIAVGADGKVYAFQPSEFIAMVPELGVQQDETVRRYSEDDGTPRQVLPLRGPMGDPGFPQAALDTIITFQNYHDLYIADVPAGSAEAASKALYDALKPGGVLVVVDHAAAQGAGIEAAQTLHRMDRQVAMDGLTAVGFVLEEESDLYANPQDDLSLSVFDESVRGSTDQFAWRLRKPES